MNDQTGDERASRWRYLPLIAGCLLLLGLAIAVVRDSHLAGAWRVGWFAVLLGLDLYLAAWLTRPPAV